MDKKLLNKLIEKADQMYLCDMVSGSRRGCGHDSYNMQLNGKFNAERLGKIVEGLSDEEREQLQDLKAEDLDVIFSGRRRRPTSAPRKIRGPVKLGKK